jgi:hypothetical protein
MALFPSMGESKTPTRSMVVATDVLAPIAAVPKFGRKPSGRHAAITKSLPDWSSYRDWVQKARSAWEEGK